MRSGQTVCRSVCYRFFIFLYIRTADKPVYIRYFPCSAETAEVFTGSGRRSFKSKVAELGVECFCNFFCSFFIIQCQRIVIDFLKFRCFRSTRCFRFRLANAFNSIKDMESDVFIGRSYIQFDIRFVGNNIFRFPGMEFSDSDNGLSLGEILLWKRWSAVS